jgi:hypothetical protein
VRTNRLFVLAMITAVVGVLPWLTGVALGLKLLGAVLTLTGLLITYLTGSVLLARRRTPAAASGGCGSCESCSCSSAGTA